MVTKEGGLLTFRVNMAEEMTEKMKLTMTSLIETLKYLQNICGLTL
jgi:hypothetical protein